MIGLLATSSFFSVSVPAFAWPTMEEVIHSQILKACQTVSHEEALNRVLAEYGPEAQKNYQMWREMTAEDCANATVPPEPSGVKGQCSSEFASIGEEFDTSNLTWRECWLEVTSNKILFKTADDTTAMVGNMSSENEFLVAEKRYNFPEGMRDYWDEYAARGSGQLSGDETVCNVQLNHGQWLQIFRPDLNSCSENFQPNDRPQNAPDRPL